MLPSVQWNCKVKTVDFKCKFCDKTFWTRNTPGENSQKEHWIKCDQCDYVTENVSNLVKHILSHEASEVCQYCHFVKMQIVKSSNVITGTQENVSTLETINTSIFDLFIVGCLRIGWSYWPEVFQSIIPCWPEDFRSIIPCWPEV